MPHLSRHLLRLLLIAALSVAAAVVRAEQGIAVIVARDAPPLSLDRATLRDIFLKKIFVDEQRNGYVPVNLPPGSPLRRAVSLGLFGQGVGQLQRYWNERYFQGVRPPYVLGSQTAVLRFVARTEGAIGYVASCRLDERVRPVLLLPVPASEREAVAALCAEPPPGDG